MRYIIQHATQTGASYLNLANIKLKLIFLRDGRQVTKQMHKYNLERLGKGN